MPTVLRVQHRVCVARAEGEWRSHRHIAAQEPRTVLPTPGAPDRGQCGRFTSGDLAADLQTSVAALALLCLSAIYDWGGPDHPQLTPMVAQVTLAIGLQHEPPAHLSEQEKERRRLLFWGVYCMDRAGEWARLITAHFSGWKPWTQCQLQQGRCDRGCELCVWPPR